MPQPAVASHATETERGDGMPRFLPGIHGLRAVAALSVLLFHQSPNLPLPAFAKPVAMYGGLGVSLFFVLSAFSLAHSTHDRMNDRGWVRDFALRRYFRIAPMFYLMTTLFVIHDFFVWHKIYSPSEIIINIFFIFGLVPGKHESIVWAGWTVGVEVLFYAVFPAILSMVTDLIPAVIFFLFSCIAAIAVVQELHDVAGIALGYFYENLSQSLPCFAGGILVYHLIRTLRRTSVSHLRLQIIAGVMTVIFTFLALALPLATWRPDVIVWTVAFSALTLWQAVAPSWAMAARPLQFIGERSYSVYLVHAPTVYYLTPVYRLIYRHVPIEGLAYLMCAALGVSCVLLVASITYALVEARGIRAGTALIRTGRPQKGNRTPITAVDHPTELNIKYNVS